MNLHWMKSLLGLGSVALWVTAAACGSDPVALDPQVLDPQVIKEVEFAASLNIDLAQMEMLANGVYRQDLVVGTGDTLVFGVSAQVGHTGWLSDATVFSSGPFPFRLGTDPMIPGFEDGILGMLEGGTRRIIIPPALGYANDPPPGSGIPQGAVLVFEVVLDSVF